MLKEISGNYKRRKMIVLKHQTGRPLTNEEIGALWENYIKETFKDDRNRLDLEISYDEPLLSILVHEVSQTIRRSNLQKAPGLDEITIDQGMKKLSCKCVLIFQ